MSVTLPFVYKFTSETRPFHVFQAFTTFRKNQFKQWGLRHWSEECGLEDQAQLSDIVRGRLLPDDDVAAKLYRSMNLCPATREILDDLIRLARQKASSRRARV